jgi:hypothetical protein
VVTQVRITDTLRIPTVVVDTAVVMETLTDTVRVEKKKLILEIIRSRDTLYLKAKCNGDTIYRSHTVTVRMAERVVDKKETPWWAWLVMVGLGFLLVLSMIKK